MASQQSPKYEIHPRKAQSAPKRKLRKKRIIFSFILLLSTALCIRSLVSSEISEGFGVGTLLLCATIAAPRVDSFISASQRSSLGMCRKCGDLKIIACSTCRGVGSVKEGGLIRFNFVDDLYQLLGGDEPGLKTIPCTKCRAKGHFNCPNCSKTQ